MIDSKALLADLQKEVTKLHTDIRARCDAEPSADAALKVQYEAARNGKRTALSYKAWREDELTSVAVAWVLACVFIRFLEDNALVETLYIGGPDAAGITRARDRQIVFFRENPSLSEREYLEDVFTEVGKLPGMADLFDRRHNSLWAVGPTGDAARALIEFWRRADAGSGRPSYDFFDPEWNTRFLGDLYQDLSESARKRYALLQTPVFIEQFILDRTLTPAIENFGFREIRMIDPTCGSGHFLLGGFERLFALWNEALPGGVPSDIAQHALDQIFGVDLNPNVVAIARFRLLLAALRVTGTARLRNAYDFKIHVFTGDSLLHGARFDSEGKPHLAERQTMFEGEDVVFRDELKHHYEVEDIEILHRILGQQYHAVVGNPPYITVKDKALNELYRERYHSCHRAYSLSVPFMERFFDLAVAGDGTPQRPAGFVGQITANSFMKREFGKKLIEEYLPRWDLTHVIDTSGAYIPGHGTPTVILFGKNQRPARSIVRAVMGIRNEPTAPEDPSEGIVWKAICQQVDHPGSTSEWVSSTDFPLLSFHKHPWSIGGGGVAELKSVIDTASSQTLGEVIEDIGRTTHTGDDNAFCMPITSAATYGLSTNCVGFVRGEDVRDYCVSLSICAIFPYSEDALPTSKFSTQLARRFWILRTPLKARSDFGQKIEERGLRWVDHSMFFPARYRAHRFISFSNVATHNHFAYKTGACVFNSHAPALQLGEDSEDEDYFRLLGILNSSVVCFWLQQVCHNKGRPGAETAGADEPYEQRFEFDCAKLLKLPIPAYLPLTLPTALVKYGTAIQGLSAAATLSAWDHFSNKSLDTELAHARECWAGVRCKLVACQEELDWQIYNAFGLVESADGVSLPENEVMGAIPTEGIQLGQRAFEIVLARRMAAGDVQTTWFERHNSTPITDVPPHWPAAYRELVERRIRRIENDPSIGLIERPENKRRWNTKLWEEQFMEAAREWLCARLEGYFHEGQRVHEFKTGFSPATAGFPPATRPTLTTTNQLAEIAKTDSAFQFVAEALTGGAGFSVPKLVRELVESNSVPFLPSQRYKPSGLLKREQWENVWALQRSEDGIDAQLMVDQADIPESERERRKIDASKLKKAKVGDIPVPQRYTSADFKKPVWWHLRGKLDVPKERWISYPGTERAEDSSPVIAWAGWNHAQQARALAEFYVDAKQIYGFPPEKLTLLLAGLLDLQPWLDQWHAELDPNYGVSPAEAIRGFLDNECHTLGVTREGLEMVRMGGSN